MMTLKEYAAGLEKHDVRRSVIEMFEVNADLFEAMFPPPRPRPWWRRKLDAMQWAIGDWLVRLGMRLGGEPDAPSD